MVPLLDLAAVGVVVDLVEHGEGVGDLPGDFVFDVVVDEAEFGAVVKEAADERLTLHLVGGGDELGVDADPVDASPAALA